MAFNPLPPQLFAPDLPPGVTPEDLANYRATMAAMPDRDVGPLEEDQRATRTRNDIEAVAGRGAAALQNYTNPSPFTSDIGGAGSVTPPAGVGGGMTLEKERAQAAAQSAAPENIPEPLNLPVTAPTPLFGANSHFAYQQASDQKRVALENAARGGDPKILAQASRKNRLANEKIARLNEQTGATYQQAGQDQAAIGMEVADQISSHQRKADDLNAAAQEAEQASLDRQDNYRKTIEATRQETLEASQKLDPQRLIGPAGSRIMFVVSAALGALGQSLLGGRNNAVDLVNSMMEKDFEGQKARLGGKKENLSLMQDQLLAMRQQGMDERSARAIVMANMNDAMANRVASLKQQGLSAEQRANGDILEKQFQMVAEQWRQKGYQATMRASAGRGPVAKPLTQSELLKLSQEALKRELDIRQGEQKIAKEAQPTSNEDNADVKRQADLATRVSAMNSALTRISLIEDAMSDAASLNPVGATELLFPNAAAKVRSTLTGGDPSAPGLASQEIEAIASDIAASRGGPATDTDQAIGKAMANIKPEMFNPATWGTGAAKERLKTLRTLIASQRKALLEGQPAQDVAAVERNTTQRPESAAEKTKRLSRSK